MGPWIALDREPEHNTRVPPPGVTLTPFVIEASPEKSACSACGCEFIPGEGIVCCSGHGTCSVADEAGMVCDCEPDYAGADCSYDVAATYFDDLPPGCDEEGMACSGPYEADDAHIEGFDLLATDGVQAGHGKVTIVKL